MAAHGNEGRKIYEANCAACHGFDGGGHGPSSYPLKPKPLNLTKGVYKFRSTPPKKLPTDEDLMRTIRVGVPGTTMPAFGGLLTQEEMSAVVDYIKCFSERFQSETAETPIDIPAETPSDAASVARGAKLYDEADCEECHGAKGRGDGPSSKDLTDQWGRPLRATDLTRRDYKGGPTPQDTYRTLMTGLDGTQMPSLGATTSPEEAWDLVHYLQSLQKKRGFFRRLFGTK